MKFFDAGHQATGIIAIGQQATGFFAFGQMATGVIAIGQLARGGIAIGQLAVGLIGWGQLGVGVYSAAGMVGVGGRRPLGIVLPLVPSIGRPRVMPRTTTLPAVDAGQDGWIEVDLARDALGLGLYENGQRLPIKIDRRLQKRAYEITTEGPCRVCAYTRRAGPVLVCERIAHNPPRPYQKKSFAALASLQLAALLVLGTVWAGVVGHDLGVILEDIVTDDGGAPARKPSSPSKPARPRGR
ncbi:Hypothetical protein A7982_07069 [Minicystis rosea]|nr:Hypothetical protein A7982_07069 [Minicystis rosea]